MPPDRHAGRREWTRLLQRLDRSIPRLLRHETCGVRDTAVNVQLAPFLALVVLPIVLINSGLPELAAAVPVAALAAFRRSSYCYRHIRFT